MGEPLAKVHFQVNYVDSGPHRLDIKSPLANLFRGRRNRTRTISSSTTLGRPSSIGSGAGNGNRWCVVLGGAVAGIMALGSSGDLETCRASNDCLQTQKEADLRLKSEMMRLSLMFCCGRASPSRHRASVSTGSRRSAGRRGNREYRSGARARAPLPSAIEVLSK